MIEDTCRGCGAVEWLGEDCHCPDPRDAEIARLNAELAEQVQTTARIASERACEMIRGDKAEAEAKAYAEDWATLRRYLAHGGEHTAWGLMFDLDKARGRGR